MAASDRIRQALTGSPHPDAATVLGSFGGFVLALSVIVGALGFVWSDSRSAISLSEQEIKKLIRDAEPTVLAPAPSIVARLGANSSIHVVVDRQGLNQTCDLIQYVPYYLVLTGSNSVQRAWMFKFDASIRRQSRELHLFDALRPGEYVVRMDLSAPCAHQAQPVVFESNPFTVPQGWPSHR